MVAAASLFLLHLSASSYHCRQGTSRDVIKQHATPLLGVTSSSSYSEPRREDRTKRFLAAPSSTESEGQADSAFPTKRLWGWEKRFGLLQQFEKREGHCNVTRSHAEDGIKLGRWVGNQRRLKEEGKLDPDRQSILDNMGFAWLLGNPTRVPWEERLDLLKEFQTREGHCHVPQLHKEDGANLGKWVNKQRQLKKMDRLDLHRQTILEDMGFEWVLVERRANVPWEETFSLLKTFKEREGHCNVPRFHKEDGANLGVWLENQRQFKKNGKLYRDRKERLEEMGIEWLLASAKWDGMYDLLKQFQKREGHCAVDLSHTEDGANLGYWVNTQRQLKKKENLDPDKQKMLDEIGFEWAPWVTWDEMYALLKQFKKREGHSNVPQSHTEDGANLGAWITTQRQLKRKEKLDPDRQTRLEQVGPEWAGRYAV
jgi:hypothetical protein